MDNTEHIIQELKSEKWEMAQEIERLRAALKDKDELVQYLEGHIDGLKKFVVQQKESE